MKVRAGKFRGARLKMASGKKIRPLTSRVKTSVFDILPRDLSNWSVLDLFAGTGSFGIEALSRSAEYVVFVDQSRKAVELIRANLKKLGCFNQAEVLGKKVSQALNQLALERVQFDLIFLDPPFEQGLAGKTLEQISQLNLLKPEGMVVVRTSTRELTEQKYGSLVLDDERKYGDSLVRFYLSSSREIIEKREEGS